MNLLEQMKPEFKETIDNADKNDIWYLTALDGLIRNKFHTRLTYLELVAITHFTHPKENVSLFVINDLFNFPS